MTDKRKLQDLACEAKCLAAANQAAAQATVQAAAPGGTQAATVPVQFGTKLANLFAELCSVLEKELP